MVPSDPDSFASMQPSSKMCVCVHVCACVHSCICVCVCRCLSVCLSVSVSVCLCVRARAPICPSLRGFFCFLFVRNHTVVLFSSKHRECQRGETNTVMAFGSNTHGQVGDGNTEDALEPKPVAVAWIDQEGQAGLDPFETRVVSGGDRSVLFDRKGGRRVDHRTLGKAGVSLPFCLTSGTGPLDFFHHVFVLLSDFLDGNGNADQLFRWVVSAVHFVTSKKERETVVFPVRK